MSDSTEAALGALFSVLEANTIGFQSWSRRLQHWNEVSDQPAGFLRHTGSTLEYEGLMPMTTVEAEVWIYSNAGKNQQVSPDIALNKLVHSVECCFAPDADYGDPRFTLGGLVYWCRIEGRSDYSPGDQGPQALARIPVRILLP